MAGQLFKTASLGGNYAQPKLSKKLRYVADTQSKFRAFCDVKDAFGRSNGDTFNWVKVADLAAVGNAAALDEATDTIAISSHTITKGTVTVTEYGRGVQLTRKLKELSSFDVDNIVRKVLGRDMVRTIDNVLYTAASLTPLIAHPTANTSTTSITLVTTGTATSTFTNNMTPDHIIEIADTMKDRNIPFFDGENYVAVANPTTLSALRKSMVSVNQYTESGYGKILNGEIGKFGNVRFVEQTNVAKGSKPWVMFFGGEALVEAVAVPEEIVVDTPTDFGRKQGLAWYGIFGWTLAWSDAANARVVLWQSA